MLTDILDEEGQALANELGENAFFIKHDVSSGEEWNTVVEETEARFGPINVLVNNAAISYFKPMEEMTEEEYRRVIDINQVGVFLGMKAVVPSMKKHSKGSIINISSVSGLKATPNALAYDSTKFAVTGMTKTAALELGKYNIRVNSVHPGTILTPMLGVGADPEIFEQTKNNTPLKRIADPEEVSRLVMFLAEDASYSTGSEFVIDGGITAKL